MRPTDGGLGHGPATSHSESGRRALRCQRCPGSRRRGDEAQQDLDPGPPSSWCPPFSFSPYLAPSSFLPSLPPPAFPSPPSSAPLPSPPLPCLCRNPLHSFYLPCGRIKAVHSPRGGTALFDLLCMGWGEGR